MVMRVGVGGRSSSRGRGRLVVRMGMRVRMGVAARLGWRGVVSRVVVHRVGCMPGGVGQVVGVRVVAVVPVLVHRCRRRMGVEVGVIPVPGGRVEV